MLILKVAEQLLTTGVVNVAFAAGCGCVADTFILLEVIRNS